MGKFDGILICSDVDGTYSGGGDTIEVNNKAVKYFTDNGGQFTFSTGRPAGYMRRPEFSDVMTAPACICNGGIVYDYENEHILLEERMNITVKDFVESMIQYNDIVKEFYIFDNCQQDYTFFPDFQSATPDALSLQPIKVIYYCKDAQSADASIAFAQQLEIFSQCDITKSDPVTVEFNSIKASKGKAAQFIKNYLGDIHTVIGVGDNGNDMALIQESDIGVAVGSAPDYVKQVADMIVKPCKEYAIKDLIEIIEAHPERFGK